MSSLLIPSASAAAANAASDGSMWGRSDEASQTPSMSQKRAPGMRSALCSARRSRPVVVRVLCVVRVHAFCLHDGCDRALAMWRQVGGLMQ
jgi:hypothetical protein